jgi:hypothetical protein
LTGGVFLLLYNTFISIAEIVVKTWRRTFASWAGHRLRDMGILQDKPTLMQPELDWKRLAVLLATLMLALVVKDLMLSPIVLMIGVAILAWINFQQKQVERAQINEDAEAVALQMRSLISVDHSLLNALQRVKLPLGIMKRGIEEVTSRLRLHQPSEQAAQGLKGLPGIVTSRLSALIANHAQLTDQIQDELLQGVVASSVTFVMLSPAWRDFFLQDISHRVLLAVMIGGVVLASLYFEFEVHQLSFGEF